MNYLDEEIDEELLIKAADSCSAVAPLPDFIDDPIATIDVSKYLSEMFEPIPIVSPKIPIPSPFATFKRKRDSPKVPPLFRRK